MKLIVEHGKTKREIKGPFNIFGDRASLETLKHLLDCALADDDFCAGWIKVSEIQPSLVNTSPVAWEVP